MHGTTAMTASYFDGYSRAPLRVGLALVAALDLASTAVTLRATPAGPHSHPLAPAWLLALGGTTLPVLVLVLAGFVGLGLFASGRRTLVGGFVGLSALALANESLAAVWLGPSRSHYFAGALLLGWLAGYAYARATGRGHDAAEAHAESAALGALTAIYLGAVSSKLVHSGLGWADATTLRGVLLCHARVDATGLGPSLEGFVVEHPGFGRAFALATLVVQAGSVLLLVDRRLRAGWGALLFGFHFVVTLTTGIGYLGAKLLVPLFTWPWSRLTAARLGFPRRIGDDELPIDPARERRARLVAGLIFACALGLALASPLRRYTALHHRHSDGAASNR